LIAPVRGDHGRPTKVNFLDLSPDQAFIFKQRSRGTEAARWNNFTARSMCQVILPAWFSRSADVDQPSQRSASPYNQVLIHLKAALSTLGNGMFKYQIVKALLEDF
jgi:hypothetical protein